MISFNLEYRLCHKHSDLVKFTISLLLDKMYFYLLLK